MLTVNTAANSPHFPVGVAAAFVRHITFFIGQTISLPFRFVRILPLLATKSY